MKKVLIPTAGLGSRLKEWKGPKALFTVNNLPAIANVIDYYPENWQVIIVIGHLGNHVREVVEFLYADRVASKMIKFVETNSHVCGGLTQSILDAELEISGEPFVFHAVDTLLENLPVNWTRILDSESNVILTSANHAAGTYRIFNGENWERKEIPNHSSAYIGVCSINRVDEFWKLLKSRSVDLIEEGETIGLKNPITRNLEDFSINWIDIGNGHKSEMDEESEVIVLPKSDEAIWFKDDLVVKYHLDTNFIAQRSHRAPKLENYVPRILRTGDHCFSYKFESGTTLSKAIDNGIDSAGIFAQLDEFWLGKLKNPKDENEDFDYLEFYKTKTEQRLHELLNIEKFTTKPVKLNGDIVKPANELIKLIDWETLCKPMLGRVHGDLHPDNIIIRDDLKIFFIDWRQNVAGSTGTLGDIYYDLGKFLHGLNVDHRLVRNDQFQLNENSETVYVHIPVSPSKKEFRLEFENYLLKNNFSLNKVRIIEALIYLNIACLHEPSKYRRFLYWWGVYSLNKALEAY